MPTFPDGFAWGAATSAYQIEGSPLADGAGPSIWHRFSHTPGHVSDGSTGDVACDHYRQWRGDLDLMADLGLDAYRFSVAWGRVLPDGTGAVNEPGLAFYDRLVDGLLERGIEPFPTLYHWDLPAALDDRGGWLNPDVAGWFADYADAVVRRLGDRVTRWTTLNEPWVTMHAGYVAGRHAPGHRNAYEAPRVAHHLLLVAPAGAVPRSVQLAPAERSPRMRRWTVYATPSPRSAQVTRTAVAVSGAASTRGAVKSRAAGRAGAVIVKAGEGSPAVPSAVRATTRYS